MSAVDRARDILERAIAGEIFPAASVDVGASGGPLWSEALGTLTFDAGSAPTTSDTLFDLASLTKAIATTPVIMDLTSAGRLRLDDPVSTFFGEWSGADRASVTVRELLEHASGLAARLVDAPPVTRREFQHEICRMPLEYAPRTRSIYSDLGFILLGFIAGDRGGRSLSALFDEIMVRLGPDATILRFDLPPDLKRRAAPTRPLSQDSRRGRLLVGDVHDDYAAALGGVAGHAGLFGSAPAVGVLARALLQTARGVTDRPSPFSVEIVAAFTARSTVPGSSRALGWDTMLPTSSCGTLMSRSAFGHVGFTGTSLWIDPDRDRYFVLLTNRVCGSGTLDDMREVRRAFHDALGDL